MHYASIGPIGASGEGIWNLVPVPDPPKEEVNQSLDSLMRLKMIHLEREKKYYTSTSKGHPNTLFVKSSNPILVDPTGTGTDTGTSMDESCAKKKKLMTITPQEMSAVISAMYTLVASVQNPQNSPKTPGFGMGHLQYVGNPQNTIVGGVSLARDGEASAFNDTVDNSPFKHSIVSENPDFSLNEFASKF